MGDDTNDKKEMAKMIDGGELIVPGAELDVDRMPPILAGQSTKFIERRVERFYFSVGAIFEAWVKKRPSPHTQRAYRQDVMALVEFLKLDWPKASTELLTVSVGDVMEWRDKLVKCYGPRSDRTFGAFLSELASQLAFLVTPVIRYGFADPLSLHPAPRFSRK